MRYVFDNDLHIHSGLSLCSNDPEQSTERILQYAKDNDLKTVCLTDHFWDETVPGASDWYKIQDYAHIAKAMPLPKADGIRYLFGCEIDMDKFMTIGLSRENFDKFDFVVIPTTHLHMMGFTLDPSDNTVERRAELWVKRLDALLSKDLPFSKIGIAHLACTLMRGNESCDYVTIMNLITDEDMERIFTKAASLGCGIELNMSDFSFSKSEPETVLRMFRIAKKCGCKFYCGSDAHHPSSLDKARAIFERAIDLLELSEDDKFII